MDTRALLLGLAVALGCAAPGSAQTWWRGAGGDLGVTLTDVETMARDREQRVIAEHLILLPTGASSFPDAAVIRARIAHACAAGASTLLGGELLKPNEEELARMGPDPTPRVAPPGSDGWFRLRLACAASDQERRRYGRRVGEAPLAELVARYRPRSRAGRRR